MIKVPLCGSCCLPRRSWNLADEELDLQLPVSLQEQDVVVVFVCLMQNILPGRVVLFGVTFGGIFHMSYFPHG